MMTGCTRAAITAPTPTPPPPPAPAPPPIAEAPSITCPSSITIAQTISAGANVTFTSPEVNGGEQPVQVSCSLTSGTTFPVGSTAVECIATDKLSRSASCSFSATVTPAPRLSRLYYMAFGDSITAGEVTFPVSSTNDTGARRQIFPLVIVPSAAYPTVMAQMLGERYVLQKPDIRVYNDGYGGEAARNAYPRFISSYNSHRVDALLLMEGYNDVGDQQNGAQSGAADTLRRMANEAAARGARVFIATLAPSRPGPKARPLSDIQAFNQRIIAVQRAEGAVLVDVYAALITDVQHYIGDDGLHPTEIGYKKIAETFFAAVKNELEIRQ